MTSDPEGDGPTDRSANSDHELSLLRRWARRKGQAQTRAPNASTAEPGDPDLGRERPAEAQDQPSDADMPPIESLGEGSDYRGFLSPRVSEPLRRAALRKLFQSPRFNIRDGLDDYDGDYTRYIPLGDTVTAHSKFHTERLQERARAGADRGSDDADGEVEPRDHERDEGAPPLAGESAGNGPPHGESAPPDHGHG